MSNSHSAISEFSETLTGSKEWTIFVTFDYISVSAPSLPMLIALALSSPDIEDTRIPGSHRGQKWLSEVLEQFVLGK